MWEGKYLVTKYISRSFNTNHYWGFDLTNHIDIIYQKKKKKLRGKQND